MVSPALFRAMWSTASAFFLLAVAATHAQDAPYFSSNKVDNADIGKPGITKRLSVAQASVGEIDLSKPFEYFKTKSHSLGRTFAFDESNHRLFFFIPDVRSKPTGANCLLGWDLDSEKGYEFGMKLFDIGPANVSFAAVPEGNETRLWFEADQDDNGYSTGLVSFLWEPSYSGEVHYPSPDMPKVAPIAGATEYSATYDPINKELVIRYRIGRDFRIISYDSKDAAANNFSEPRLDFQLPDVPSESKAVRGYAALGENLYIFTGDEAFSMPNTHVQVTHIDTETGKVARAPEGINMVGLQHEMVRPQGLGVRYRDEKDYELIVGAWSRSKSAGSRAHLWSNREMAI